MDEALDFRDGFELPGDLRVLGQRIDSVYTLNPADYAGTRDVRMREAATVKIEFTVTRPAEPLDLISLNSPLYTLLPENFEIRRLPAQSLVSSEVVSYIDGNIVAQLRGTQIRSTLPG